MPIAEVTGLTCGRTQATPVHASDVEPQTCPDDGATLERQHTVRLLAFEFTYLANA
jgi:hypothetical protein